MYAIIDQRQVTNPGAIPEIRRQFTQDFQPKLQHAPGFVAFYRVQGAQNMITAVILWQDKAHADAFGSELARWEQTLEAAGFHTVSAPSGEVVTQLTPET